MSSTGYPCWHSQVRPCLRSFGLPCWHLSEHLCLSSSGYLGWHLSEHLCLGSPGYLGWHSQVRPCSYSRRPASQVVDRHWGFREGAALGLGGAYPKLAYPRRIPGLEVYWSSLDSAPKRVRSRREEGAAARSAWPQIGEQRQLFFQTWRIVLSIWVESLHPSSLKHYI